MIETFNLDTFTPLLNTKFAVAGGQSELELVDAQDMNTTPRQEQFSLIFRGPLDSFLQQGVHPIEHEKLGSFELFLVPIKKDNEAFYYEAVFNRMR